MGTHVDLVVAHVGDLWRSLSQAYLGSYFLGAAAIPLCFRPLFSSDLQEAEDHLNRTLVFLELLTHIDPLSLDDR